MLHVESVDALADPTRIGVDERGDPEAAGAEPGVVGKGMTEIADPDDDDGVVLGQPEDARDLVNEVLDVVADTAGAVGTEVRQVLAQLRRTDARRGGQRLRGDRRG